MPQKVFFKTFGCRTNFFDEQVMIANLKDYNVVRSEDEADIVVINSCTVTNGADVNVRQYLNRLEKKNKTVFFTGCGSEFQGKAFFDEGRMQGVFGHSEKESINEHLKSLSRFYKPGNKKHMDTTLVEKFVGKSRAFIKIQEGCDFTCSYCIIPAARGGARSQSEEKILNQITRLAEEGYSECILTGTNVGSYGKDTGSSLAQLIRKIGDIKGIKRVRLGSIEPSQLDSELMELLDAPYMSRHMHIAIQHSSNSMLERMQRINRFESDLVLFETLADKGFAIGTDYIVGHPGEDEQCWEEAWRNIQQMPLTHLHLFTYSIRENTPAASMTPQVNGAVAKERYRMLQSWVEEQNRNFRQKNRIPLDVLVENHQENRASGLDQFFNRMEISGKIPEAKQWLRLNEYEVNHEKNLAEIQ